MLDWIFTRWLVARAAAREEGQTLAEYALILVLIAVVAIVALTLLGTNIRDMLNNLATHIAP